MERQRKQQFVGNTLFLLTLALWGMVLLKLILPATLPFWVGLAVASLLKPVTLWLSHFLNFRRKSAAFSVLLIFYLLLGFFLWGTVNFLFLQGSLWIEELPVFYEDNVQPFLHRCALVVNGFLDDVSPQTARQLVEKSAELTASLASGLSSFSAAALSSATGFAKKIPFWLTTVAFSVLCSVFISMDYNAVIGFLLRQFPPKYRQLLLRCKNILRDSLLQMLKAYSILLLITFGQLALGFFLLRIERPLLWAAVLALLDFLPFIGTGLVLLPWGLFHLLGGRSALGAGLILLYAILAVVHNLMEPKLVSSSMGLHPLATLAAMYAGLRLLGIGGLLLAPVLLLLLCHLQKDGYLRIFR